MRGYVDIASKEKAIALRKKGYSIRAVEQKLGVHRSTLSGWFKNVELTKIQKQRLLEAWRDALTNARAKAVLWHNAQKTARMELAGKEAHAILRSIRLTDLHILELALAVLYLGEGSKKNVETALGSSDPLILKFFLFSLRKLYGLENKNIRCELYLRADQSPKRIKEFWSRELKLPLQHFRSVNIDKRTIGSRTYNGYHGVCNIRCGNVAFKRRLLYLCEAYFQTVLA